MSSCCASKASEEPLVAAATVPYRSELIAAGLFNPT